MKISLISNPYETTPPIGYGGSERVISVLAEGLVKKGHEVNLFATENSKTNGNLYPILGKPIKVYDSKPEAFHILKALELSHDLNVDLIHCNIWNFSMLLSYLSDIPTITTLHNDIETSPNQLKNTFYKHMFVSISHNQEQRMRKKKVNIIRTVYNSIDTDRFTFSEVQGNYLCFIGNIAPHKGLHYAISVAKQTGIPLKFAGIVSKNNQEYFDYFIKPHIDNKNIEFVGELNDVEKMKLYSNAYVTLFPVEWEEPFGLVMIESMACGTPVIAFNKGSIPEVVNDGLTGFIVDDLSQMINTVEKINSIDRNNCRIHVRNNFDNRIMINNYEKLYFDIIKQKEALL